MQMNNEKHPRFCVCIIIVYSLLIYNYMSFDFASVDHSPSPSNLKRSHDNIGLSSDIEDIAISQKRPHTTPTVTKHTTLTPSQPFGGSWRNVLGPPPSRGTTKVQGWATENFLLSCLCPVFQVDGTFWSVKR